MASTSTYVNLDIGRYTASKRSHKILRNVSIDLSEDESITYVNLSGRSTTNGVGNTYSADTGIAGGAVDGEQIDQIGSFQC